MPNFTPEQLDVINETGKNITVSASAGSGKTTVLVERIMKRVLVDNVPLDRILAMTFTEAAASEMKKRLAKELNDHLTKGIYNPDIIKEQLIKLQNAQISTIDSFCLSVIKENYAHIGFNIERCDNIIMAEDALRYEAEAMAKTIQEYEAHPSFMKLRLYVSTKAYNQSELEGIIRRFANIFDDQSLASIKQQTHSIYTATNFASMPSNTIQIIKQYLTGSIFSLQNKLQSLDNALANEEDEKKYAKCHNAIDLKIRKLELCLSYLANDNFSYAAFKQAYMDAVNVRLETNANDFYTKLRKDIHANEDGFLNELYDESNIIHDLNEDYEMVDLLLDMSYSYLTNFRNIKEREAVMDFSDMEHYALQILETSKDVQNHYKELFIDIMVDEFQDSSYMQDRMLSLITNGTNIFRVGDVKQSIYGFRKAVPDLLKSYIDRPTNNDSVKFLQHNFRSNEQIITYVNQLFQAFMNQQGLESGFNDKDIALVGSKAQECKETCIEYHSLITDMKATSDDENNTKNEIRANYIANMIASDKLNTPNSKWSDYVILLRSHTNKKLLKDAFESRNIPYFMDAKEGFYKSNVVTNITSFLHAIIEPHVDIYFIAIAISPFYKLTNSDIANAYLEIKKHQYYSFYDYAKESNHDTFKQIANDLQTLSKLPSIREKLEYIYTISNFYDDHCTIQERNNLDFLLEKTANFELKYPNALHKFLNQIEQSEDTKSSEALSHNSNEDVVTVMTIHQSKGLQFKKVIYWGKESTGINHNGSFIYDTASSIVFHHIDMNSRIRRNSLLYSAVAYQNKLREVEEEIRLIYVALTRAKEKLFMIAIRTQAQHEQLVAYPLVPNDLINKGKYLDYIYHLSRTFSSKLIAFRQLDVHGDKLILPKVEHQYVAHIRLNDYEHQPITFTASSHDIELYEWNDMDINYADIGTLTHSILEHIDIRKTYTLDEIKALAPSLNNDLADKVYYKSVLAYLNHPFTQALNNDTITHELPFITKIDNQITKGYIDMVVESASEVIIIDYKTDRNVTKDELITRYKKQLATYKTALANTTKKLVKTYIYSLTLEDYIEV
ncbi:MAG: UvrD-helicase domain-containing protein [Erysipelotrichales bacterium]|nr:UvrD-helicase domain-containing protein [Erysipelotrichales bacterium]